MRLLTVRTTTLVMSPLKISVVTLVLGSCKQAHPSVDDGIASVDSGAVRIAGDGATGTADAGLSDHIDYLALAGKGDHAYLRLARMACRRELQCNYGRSFEPSSALIERCAKVRAPQMAETVLGCDERYDYQVNPTHIARCLEALAHQPCRAGIPALSSDVAAGFLVGCREAVFDLTAAEDAVLGLRNGAPCTGGISDPRCPTDSSCTATSDNTCGVCEKLPFLGQPCETACSGPLPGHATCSHGTCASVYAAGEGESCTQDRVCAEWYQCSASGVCVAIDEGGYDVGDPCTLAAGCGPRLTCLDGRCHSTQQLYDLGLHGCMIPDDCESGMCTNGMCQPIPDLGEPCAKDCRNYYACIDGHCAEPVGCSLKSGDSCSYAYQCEVGLCNRLCSPGGKFGGPCTADGTCQEGMCAHGSCVRGTTGSPCDSDFDCQSIRCSQGKCTAPLCN